VNQEPKLDLILLWHMHQPDFRDPANGEFVLPWVYLHAIKDYIDMAAHLEDHPGVRATVNFVPILVEQLEDYAAQFARGEVRDPLLRLLGRERLDGLSPQERELILEACFRAHQHKMIEPFAQYKRLHELVSSANQVGAHARYFSADFLGDLLTWYHLSWTGETVRRSHDLVQRLMAKGEHFSFEDRRALFELIGGLVATVVPRYRRLAQRGQIELCASPYHHPIGPLLLDLRAAREAQPDSPLPACERYPGGQQRLAWHLQRAEHAHRQWFEQPLQGMWPAEGAVSTDFLRRLAAAGMRWAASGEGVLEHSLRRQLPAMPPREQYLYRPYQVGPPEQRISCFFRDDRLSDLIGFEYAKWHGADACAHFIGELEAIARNAGRTRPVVGVMLDGENAWESYPYNGYYFLDGLYEALEQHAFIRVCTPSRWLEEQAATAPDQRRAGVLPAVTAGSWVYGNLSTWIGSHDKNLAWDALCKAKLAYDRVLASGALSQSEIEAATRQLGACEGSDWFWWFGDYNPSESVASFDRLFRDKLKQLYRTLGVAVPDELESPFSSGGGHAELGGSMRRAS
jgi:alpha-amylase/alpha-mannosidase (GH57 family)